MSAHLINQDEPTPIPSGGGELLRSSDTRFPSWEGSGVGLFISRRIFDNQ